MLLSRRFFGTVLLGMAVLVAGGSGCAALSGANPPDEADDPRVATVDSVEVPARIAPTDTLAVRLRGTVGPNGCYALDRLRADRTDGRLTLTPLVQYRGGPNAMCTMQVVPLDETHRAAPPFDEGVLTVTVPQPDGPARTATVTVSRDAE
jgi:hypothetical protein